MGCKLRILTLDEIEKQVSACSGTWRKRSNLRKRLLGERKDLIDFVIANINDEIRRLKASTAKEEKLRILYSFKSRMERKLIYSIYDVGGDE